MQFLQIYCDNIMDMINPNDRQLKIWEDNERGVYVQELSTIVLETKE